jgi:hypothetical protein
MIEVDVFLKPFIGSRSVSIIAESLIDGVQVFHSALSGNELMSWFEHWHVAECNSNGVPSLFDFRVGVISNSQISVKSLEKEECYFLRIIDKFKKEDNLLIGIEVFVVLVVGRRGFALSADIV